MRAGNHECRRCCDSDRSRFHDNRRLTRISDSETKAASVNTEAVLLLLAAAPRCDWSDDRLRRFDAKANSLDMLFHLVVILQFRIFHELASMVFDLLVRSIVTHLVVA